MHKFSLRCISSTMHVLKCHACKVVSSSFVCSIEGWTYILFPSWLLILFQIFTDNADHILGWQRHPFCSRDCHPLSSHSPKVTGQAARQNHSPWTFSGRFVSRLKSSSSSMASCTSNTSGLQGLHALRWR